MKLYKFIFIALLITGINACKRNETEQSVVLLSPPSNISVTTNDRTATITWNTVEGADGYLVEVSEEPDFSSFHFQETVTTSSVEVTELANDRTYYLRINAITENEAKYKSSLFITQVFVTGGTSEIAYAFPGAEGYGRIATGGRGGRVIKVTNLNDSGPGSLRAAVAESGPRIIVFEVSGYIVLNSNLRITNGDVTIAGQTAPGDGICIRDFEVTVDADNVVIRYMRFRLGDVRQRESDAFWGRYHQNIIIDHCTMSWSIDETSSFYANQNFTMQWCILSESLNKSFHEKDDHGYGAIWGGLYASFHHNLLAHHNSRNPRFNGGSRSGVSNGPYPGEWVDYRNNVVYNWGDNSSYGGENGNYNMVNNYYKPGPGTPSSKRSRLLDLSISSDIVNYPPGYGKFYISGNIIHNNSAVNSDNWNGVDLRNGVDIAIAKLTSPFDVTALPTTHSAEIAYERVLSYAGASYKRDAVDIRVIDEVRNGTHTYVGSKTGKLGLIDSQNDVGGFPALAAGTPPVDTDGDGMPDAWEIANGLDPTKNDANGRKLSAVYDNIEVYINSLVNTITQNQNQ